MIEMKWAQIRDPELFKTLNKIANAKVEYKVALKIVGILKAIEEEQKKSDAMFKILTDKHYAMSEDKKFFEPKKGEEEEAKKAVAEFNGTRFTIDYPKLKHSELSRVDVAAIDILKLEAMLEADDAKENKKPTEEKADQKGDKH
jgi:hypothetical protein